MYYSNMMQATFESEKNRKALTYTVIICGILLLLAFIITWPIVAPSASPVQDLIEINLGNNDEGEGQVQPLIKGAMEPAQEPAAKPQQAAASNEPATDAEPDENAEADAAPVSKPEKAIPKSNTPPKENVAKPVKVNNPAPVTTPPVSKPQKPKFTYNGPGNGTGNGATEDNGYKYQGNKPGGKGDAGDPSGKPDSYGNNPGGRSGISVVRGARPLNLGSLKLEDDFNENAKVYLDIRYNASGGFISSSVSKGTTTSNASILSIAKREAAKLKFPVASDGGITIMLFNFKVQN